MTKTEAKAIAYMIRFTSDYGDFVAIDHAESLVDIHHITEAMHPFLNQSVPVMVISAKPVESERTHSFDTLFDAGRIRWESDVLVVVAK